MIGFPWQAIVTIFTSFAHAAKPVAVATPNQDLIAVLPDSKVFWVFIVLNAAHLIWSLLKSLWDAHKRKTDNTAENVAKLVQVVERLEHQVANLNDKMKSVPTMDQVENIAWKKVKEMKEWFK